ncbi:MAG TPA: hypothetical protein VGR35_20115 [Tepidisphaeraceae bacterium]|nr:hypothetical protein [Tepidisphaeraceae bacterium]
MTQRERSIASLTGIVVGALMLYQFVIDPKLVQIEQLESDINRASAELDQAQRLFDMSRSANRRLAEMAGSGLRRTDASAESELLNRTRQWAQEAGISGWGIKRERTEKERDFNKITFRANGTGGMRQIGKFLYHLQTADIPVRVADMTINSRKDGTDDLAIVLSISTIYLSPDDRPTGAARPGGATPSRSAEVEL